MWKWLWLIEPLTCNRKQRQTQAQNLKVCSIDDELLAKLKKFRFRKEKTNAAIIMKIDMDSVTVVLDKDIAEEDELEDISVDDLRETLPTHHPRFVAYSYCLSHDDGRISYPLCFIFISPTGCKPEMQMMYAGSKLSLVKAGGFSKVFEIRNPEELTEDWLIEKLKFFR